MVDKTAIFSQNPREAVASLKGCAMVAAIEAGMVPRTEANDGYMIGAFLRFWESFSPMLSEQIEQIVQFEKECAE